MVDLLDPAAEGAKRAMASQQIPQSVFVRVKALRGLSAETMKQFPKGRISVQCEVRHLSAITAIERKLAS